MNGEAYITRIDEAAEKCLSGAALSAEEIESLLDIPIGSDADGYLQRTARRVSSEITGDRGYLWCAVGMDFAPCPMNCEFCSFGAEWGLTGTARHVTAEEIINHASRFAAGGAAYLILRTTEFYDLDTLLDYIPKIRAAVPGDYQIVLNTGELDMITAERCAAGGVYGVYHARRLGEGVTTPFSPETRISTMQSIGASPLSLISLVEPVGEEHTNREIARSFADIVSCGAEMSGIMARVPVKGTPLGDTPMISEEKIAHIVAALRLSGGRSIRDICAHPATKKITAAGANVVVVETGAIPRDSAFSEREWSDTGMSKARALLESGGYRIAKVAADHASDDKSCPCNGGTLDKFMQPIILHILSREPLNGYATQKKIAGYATFDGRVPDMSATYRFLKRMEQRGLLSVNDGRYCLTVAGRRCLSNWRKTIRSYESVIAALAEQLRDQDGDTGSQGGS